MIDFSSVSPIIDFIVTVSDKSQRSFGLLPGVLFFIDLLVTNGIRIAFNHMALLRPRPRFRKSSAKPK